MEPAEILILIGVLLGACFIPLDAGNRLLGSNARYRLGRPLCVLLAVAGALAPLALGALPLAFPASLPARALAIAAAAAGVASFLHYLFPWRRGIRGARELESRPVMRDLVPPVRLKEVAVRVPRLSPAAEGLTILILSDLHCSNPRQVEFVRRCVERLNGTAQRPDLVCILGDLGEDEALLPQVVETLSAMRARLGAFCVRGNHDLEYGRGELLRELLDASPIRLLAGRACALPERDVVVAGVEIPWRKHPLPDLPQAGLRIVLTHTADNLPALHRLEADLVLAGHTHGGRLRLPLVGSLCVPSALGRFLNLGLFRLGDTLLYITGGVGSGFGGVGAVREVVLLTLTRGTTGPSGGPAA